MRNAKRVSTSSPMTRSNIDTHFCITSGNGIRILHAYYFFFLLFSCYSFTLIDMIHLTASDIAHYALAFFCFGLIGLLALMAYQIMKLFTVFKTLFFNVKLVNQDALYIKAQIKENLLPNLRAMLSLFFKQQLVH